ncbi:enoyl-CoA hydratase [Lewinellaceae bacterium SD302]|nr:enoyl-CoA hydratase [Lewinellaceae bacterium SD302]
MTEPYVKHQIDEDIATVEFFHPAHNSLPSNLLAKLAETITELGENEAVKVVILKSGGDRTFCAGASFEELINIQDKEEGLRFFSGFANVINAMRKCPKFIIGRVQGKAVGGGVGLASAVDYCMATKFASIKLSELNVGIGPFVVGPAIERKIGVSAMSQIAIRANNFFSPDWAMNKGLYTEIFDDAAALDTAISELAQSLTKYNPNAMVQMKRMFWSGTDHWDELLAERAAISGELVLSEFTKETLKRFA